MWPGYHPRGLIDGCRGRTASAEPLVEIERQRQENIARNKYAGPNLDIVVDCMPSQFSPMHDDVSVDFKVYLRFTFLLVAGKHWQPS